MKKFTLAVGYCIFITLTAHAQWGLNGNAIVATNFLGSTNAQNLVFKCDGIISGYLDLSTNNNTFFGIGSGNPSGALSGNAAFGYKALAANTAANNTAFGTLALTANTSGDENTAVGVDALSGNTTGVSNTAVGPYQMMVNTTGSYNSSFGSASLSSNKTGWGNCAFGQQTLNSNTASYNSAFGYLALDLNSTGSPNCAFGYYALVANSTGSHNVAVGDSTMAVNTTGTENTAVGDYAGPSTAALTNTGAFGYGAKATGSNEIVVGNSSITTIGGFAAWTTFPSDRRFKKNIQENVPGMAFIRLLRPVTYNVDVSAISSWLDPAQAAVMDRNAVSRKESVIYTGFIAQEVESAAKQVSYDFSGVTAPQSDKDVYGLRYSEFVVPLVKAVQELGGANDSLRGVIDSLKTVQASLQNQISALAQQFAAFKATAGALQQNVPNPFNSRTIIPYTLPAGFARAELVIMDVSGHVLKDVMLEAGKGPGEAVIQAGDLASGTYYYSLFVDGKQLGTRKMVLAR